MEESKKKIEKYMQEATERLNAGDLDSAAFKVRKALEVLVKELCDEMEIEIKVKGKDRDSLNAILSKIKETNSETRVLKYSDIESMYTVKQVGNIASHDDEEKHLEKATGEIKVRNAIDTMYLLLESLSDNNKLKLKVSVNTMLESARKEENKTPNAKPEMNIVKPATSYKGSKNYAARTSTQKERPAIAVAKTEQKRQDKTPKERKAIKNAAQVLKSIAKWDVLIAIMTGIVYFVGGVKYAVYIGMGLMILVDILLITRAVSKEKKKALPTVAFIVVAALLIALSGVGSYFISPASAATRALNSGDVDSAQSIIQNKVEGNPVQEKLFARSVNNYYDSVVKEYVDNSDEEEVKRRLQPLTKITSTDIGKKATDFIASIDAYSQGKTAYDNKDYINAVKLLTNVTKDFPNYKEAQEMISSARDTYKKNLFAEVGTPETLEQCESALKLLNEGAKAFPDDPDIDVKASEIKTTYLNRLDSEVKKCIESYDSDQAYELIAKAKELLGNTDEISELSKLIADVKPVPLYSLAVINEDATDEPYDVIKDTFGNEYQKDSAYLIEINYSSDEGGYVKYNTSGGYRKLKGTIGVEENAGEKFNTTITLEDENGQPLEEFTLTRDTNPVDIDINIAGVESVTFRAKNNVGNLFTTPGTGDVIIGNFAVYK